MPRLFSSTGTNTIGLSPGALSGLNGGNCTFVALMRFISGTPDFPFPIRCATSTNADVAGILFNGDTQVGFEVGGSVSSSSSVTLSAADGWGLIGASKASGTAIPRLHVYKYAAGTFAHANAVTSLANASAAVGSGGRINLGDPVFSGFNHDLDAVAAFNYVLTDAQFEQLPFSLDTWLSMSPGGMWVLDQPTISQKVLDWTGGGANQTSISGTAVSTSSVPVLSYGHPVITTGKRAAPNLVEKYFVNSAGQNTSTLTTPSFTPHDGEVIAVKSETWDTGTSMGSVTGGSQTWTSRIAEAPGGFNGWAGIHTATVSGSPGSMTVSATPSASSRHSMLVERWSNAQLAATPATDGATDTTGAAHSALTTTAAASVASWVADDAQSVDPATRTLLSSGVDEAVRDDHAGNNGVGYYGYQLAPTAGSTGYGLSAPTGMKFVIAGIEIQAPSAGGGTQNAAAALNAASSLTAGATKAVAGALAMTAASALTATATQGTSGAVAMGSASALTSDAAVVKPGAVTMGAASALTTAAVVVRTGAVTMAASSSLTAAATQSFGAAVAMGSASALLAAAAVVKPGAVAMTSGADVTVAATQTGAGAVAMSSASSLTPGATQTSASAAPMTSASSLTAGGIRVAPGALAMTAGSALAAGATTGSAGTVTMTAGTSLTAVAGQTNIAALAMTAGSALSTAGVRVQPGAVTMASASSLTADATSGAATGSSMTASSGLTAAAGQISAAAVAMSSASGLAATGTRLQPGAATMAANSGLSAAATQTGQAAVTMSAASSVTAAGTTTTGGTGTILAAVSSMTAAAVATGQGAAPMSAVANLAANAGGGQTGAVAMGAGSGLTVDAVRGSGAAAAMTAASSVTAAALRVVLGAGAMSAASNLTAAGSVITGTAAAMTGTSALTAGALAQQAASVAMDALSGLVADASLGLRGQVAMTSASNLSSTVYVPPTFYQPGILTAGSTRTAPSAGTTPYPRLTAGTLRGPSYTSGGGG